MTNKCVVVLLGGGHAAGKKSTASLLKEELQKLQKSNKLNIVKLDLEDYKVVDSSSCSTKPSRFDFDGVRNYIQANSESEDFQTVFIVYGLYALYNKELRNISHMRVFIDSDLDTRLIRWIRRDVLQNKVSTLEDILYEYMEKSREEMSEFIFPTKEYADVVMPRGPEPHAVSLLVDGILPYLSTIDLNSHTHTSIPLRPMEHFNKEKFDGQKGSFYEIN
ncbi:uncharacterized protein KQ657_003684 [Scheffersomyces spartinae]|uniref:Phosphoribulokinase/uridine kinase domain-containing protein n=1 Tax=Scheffersomyces spartinae TaxID=45513 RepID=A0A9P7VCF5_9ASCO|nr:uncharacterized protein KQ657_003684 [Scheffersomyces spartinae]KAG7195160.1 hypothetical protein KQ657_003684 [Scheffersomyces spartinae]